MPLNGVELLLLQLDLLGEDEVLVVQLLDGLVGLLLGLLELGLGLAKREGVRRNEE